MGLPSLVQQLLVDHLSIGDLLRVARTDRSAWAAACADVALWQALHVRIGVRAPRAATYEDLARRIVSTRRCRQCGLPTRSVVRAPAMDGRTFSLCPRCTAHGCYCRLITREQASLRLAAQRGKWRKRVPAWARQPRSALVAKLTRTGGHLYWPSSFSAPLPASCAAPS